jgi:hypothetical protein
VTWFWVKAFSWTTLCSRRCSTTATVKIPQSYPLSCRGQSFYSARFRIWGNSSFPTTGFTSKCTRTQFLFLQKHWHKSRARLIPYLRSVLLMWAMPREFRETLQFSENSNEVSQNKIMTSVTT